jgi:hypothetical protein
VCPHFFLRCGVLVVFSSTLPCNQMSKMNRTYAVDSPRWQACVALAADHLVAVVLGGKRLERRLNDTTTETEDQMESRLLLDVVVGKGAAVLELLAGEDQALLVRGNALLVLDLGLDIVDGLENTVRILFRSWHGACAYVAGLDLQPVAKLVNIHLVKSLESRNRFIAATKRQQLVKGNVRDRLSSECLHEDLHLGRLQRLCVLVLSRVRKGRETLRLTRCIIAVRRLDERTDHNT